MAWLIGILIFVEALCSLLLITVVLMQRTKGEGLGMAFGAQMGESLFGARAGNVLVKVTIWLGIIFLVNTTFLAMLYARTGTSSSVMDKVGHTTAPVPVTSQQPSADSPFQPMVVPEAESGLEDAAPVTVSPEQDAQDVSVTLPVENIPVEVEDVPGEEKPLD